MMKNFSLKQAETLMPGKLALEGLSLATKTWPQFAKFVLISLVGYLVLGIFVAIWQGIGLPLGGLIGFLLFCFFSLLVAVGGVRLSLAVADGQKLTVKETFAVNPKVMGSFILATILYYLVVLLGFAVLVVPGFCLALGCSYFLFVLVDKPEVGPIKALKASWAIANGDIFNIWLLSVASGIFMYLILFPAYEIGLMLLGVGGLFIAIDSDSLIILPGLLMFVLGVVCLVAIILTVIGSLLAVAMSYRILSKTRSAQLTSVLKS